MASNDRTTKAQRREAARAKARAMREEQERKDRRARLTRRALIGAAVVGVAGVGGTMYVQSRNRPQLSGGTIASKKASTAGVPGPVLSDASWTYGGSLEPGSTASGATIVEIFFDYSCHFCAYFENLHHDEIKSLVESGDVTVVLRPSKLLKSGWTDMAMNAMGLVLDEQPEASFAFHAALMTLFARIYDAQDTSMMTVANIVTAAGEAGVSADVSARIDAAIKENRYAAWTALGDQTLKEYGVNATPTVLVAGKTADLTKIATATGLTDLIRAGGVAG
ncbi:MULTISPECIES: thioredoxin domain-containing protein [unclassified Actinomyces]|uniref:DsbA family protein n=1 Tax=unclassified Actinomyces TaxID=2609248 RepID=UPI0020172E6B|nr:MULTISPECIES: thioredoxin domain-containing protein [unclassified Actinomyces]MCL3778123.1 thioredoxin domain-containing protein [Actinomyces sp. AC-20-1]MCL3789400.1 thioredoxin domain-containing protein [Actinomyces sp. 187325]MCL3791743.1 thioredoxin domain-containing protein [Actinomyces sp. 186855]MCL3794395.1 thioredoxin domain-containing protein [Actinomyces sp. 217892]